MSVNKKQDQDQEQDDKSPHSCITSNSTDLNLKMMKKKQRFCCSFDGVIKRNEIEVSSDDDLTKSTVEDDDDDDDGDDEEEVESGLNGASALGSMSSLEESLPIKRGLSKFYGGKSRSFTNLMEIRRVEDVTKPEHPFNKRKRILKTSRFYSAVDLCSMHVVDVDDDIEDEQECSNVKKTKTDESMQSNLFC